MSVHFKSRMLNLKDRLSISDNSWGMLKAYDDFKTSRIDEGELGRKVRLSPNSRASMIDTLLQCVQIMNDQPDERKHCLDIIAALGEMIKMRGKRTTPLMANVCYLLTWGYKTNPWSLCLFCL